LAARNDARTLVEAAVQEAAHVVAPTVVPAAEAATPFVKVVDPAAALGQAVRRHDARPLRATQPTAATLSGCAVAAAAGAAVGDHDSVVPSDLPHPPLFCPMAPTSPLFPPAAARAAIAAVTAEAAPSRFPGAEMVSSALPDASGAADAATIASAPAAAAFGLLSAPPGAGVSRGGGAAAADAARPPGSAGKAPGFEAPAVAAPLACGPAAGAGLLAVASDVPPAAAAAAAAGGRAASVPCPNAGVAPPMPSGLAGGSVGAVVAASVRCPPTPVGLGRAPLPADGAPLGAAPPQHAESVPVAAIVVGAPRQLAVTASAGIARAPHKRGAASTPRFFPFARAPPRQMFVKAPRVCG